jgi:hypothetical protein
MRSPERPAAGMVAGVIEGPSGRESMFTRRIGSHTVLHAIFRRPCSHDSAGVAEACLRSDVDPRASRSTCCKGNWLLLSPPPELAEPMNASLPASILRCSGPQQHHRQHHEPEPEH